MLEPKFKAECVHVYEPLIRNAVTTKIVGSVGSCRFFETVLAAK